MDTVRLSTASEFTASRESPRRAGVAQALGLGLGLVLSQIVLACLLSGKSHLGEAYLTLASWDSNWYGGIIEKGYHTPPTLRLNDCGNVAFFPAYPLGAGFLRWLTGWPTKVCLLVAAQLAAWGFWTYLFLLFRRWGISPTLTAVGALLTASHPAAFFLVAGYTESLFLCGLLGFLYWWGVGSKVGLCQAALHGLVMTATRFVGIPVVLYPLIHVWLNTNPAASRRSLRRFLPALAVAACAALGAGLFFLYCHCRFGQWDLYMKTGVIGWGTSANYLAFFSRRTYLPRPPFLVDGFLNPIWFNQFLVPMTLLVIAALCLLEYRCRRWPGSGWRFRAGLYACAAFLFYVSVCGNSGMNMYSMVRFVLCVDVLLVAAVIHWLSQVSAADRRRLSLRVLLGVWVVFGFLFQCWFTYRFTHELWVA